MREQKRGRRIAMNDDEVDAFLGEQRMCRVASVGADGAPHASPLWFVWDGSALWLHSIVKSQRWTNLMRDARVSVVVDAGDGYFDLRGVEMMGSVEVVGEVPRSDGPSPETSEPERLWGDRYAGGTFVSDGKHGWLRLTPDKIVSWDFRKIGG